MHPTWRNGTATLVIFVFGPIQEQEMRAVYLFLTIATLWACTASAGDKPCYPTKSAKLPVITGMTYHRARQTLLLAGWQPRRTKAYTGTDQDPDISHGNGKLFWNRGYIEVEACAGTGVGTCSFLFEDVYGNRLRVITEGEELPKLKAHAVVVGYRFVCEEQ